MPFRTNRLIELRKSRDLNQHQLAEHLGLSRSQVQRYENGTALPKDEALIGMAQFFNTSTDYLLGLSNMPHPDAEPEPDLAPLEAEIVTMMRTEPESVQRVVVEVVRAMLAALRRREEP